MVPAGDRSSPHFRQRGAENTVASAGGYTYRVRAVFALCLVTTTAIPGLCQGSPDERIRPGTEDLRARRERDWWDPRHRDIGIDEYVENVEGRWLEGEELQAFRARWEGTPWVGTLLQSRYARIAALDLDRDGREELVACERGTYYASAVLREEKATMRVLCKHQQGYDGGSPKLIDFDRDGRLDIVFQGGKGWTVQLLRTTENGMELVACGKGGLHFERKGVRLTWVVPCGRTEGRYGGADGGGRIQRHVPYEYFWSSERKGFSLLEGRSVGNELADALWTCHQRKPEAVDHDRYIDSWNYAVCLLASRLEYDKALELARCIPESPKGEKGKTMSSPVKQALMDRVKELSRTYKGASMLPQPRESSRGDVLTPHYTK
jgi:hypothetical protein